MPTIKPAKYFLAFGVVFIIAFILFVLTYLYAESRNEIKVRHILAQDDGKFINDGKEALVLAKEWLFANMRPNGLFLYDHNLSTGEETSKNNEVRQLLASRILAAECAASHDGEICLKHRKNLEFIIANWYKEGEHGGYIEYGGRSKLGGNAAFLMALAASPYFDEYREKAGALFRNIRYLQNDDGSFRAWYIKPPYTYYEDHLLTFYSGEALLALLEYYQKEKNESVLSVAQKSQDYYMRHYVDEMKTNYYPSLVPWQTQSLSRLYKVTGDKKYIGAAFILNDKLLEIQDRTDYIGRFYNPETPQYGSPHSSSDGVDTEGLIYALDLAKTAGDKEREARYRDAIKLAFHNLLSLQYRPSLLNPFPEAGPEDIGALRADSENSWIRIDTTTHTIDALGQLIKVW